MKLEIPVYTPTEEYWLKGGEPKLENKHDVPLKFVTNFI